MAKPLVKLTFKNKKAFELALDEFVEKTIPGKHLLAQKKIAIELLSRIIDRTPVGNPDFWAESSLPPPKGYVGGRARGNWQVSTSRPGNSDIDATDKDGDVTEAAGIGKMGTAKAGGTIWIFNNVRYIKALEMGHSRRQAPLGMVAVSLAEIEAGLV